ncbi:hypothetical protein B7463_g11982, partial [Scytalidium lignicola]
MFSSRLLASLLLAGNAIAVPHYFEKRNECDHDNLLRCFIVSSSAAEGFCGALTPLTTTVETVTATVSTTTTTTVVTTGTDTITETILTTYVIPATTTTVTVNAEGSIVQKRQDVPTPDCLGTTYPASRITSACSCIGVPALTVSATYTASTETDTVVATESSTATVDVTTTVTAGPTTYPTVTATVTCGVPSPTDVIVNGGFECDTLTPWTVKDKCGGTTVEVIAPGDNSKYLLHTKSDWLAGNNGLTSGATFSQKLKTTPHVLYSVSFDLKYTGSGINYWSVDVNGKTLIPNSLLPVKNFKTFETFFIASTNSDVLNVSFNSALLSKADFYWDNFVVKPVINH